MVPSCCHALNADVDGRKEDGVVEAVEACCGAEGGEEPRSDDAVVHSRVPVRGQRAGGGGRCLGDDRVLVVRRGKPWLDGAACEKAEERVALDQDALVRGVSEEPSG